MSRWAPQRFASSSGWVALAVLAASAPSPASAAELVYLNRDGGSYEPGIDNSRINRSSLVVQTSFVPAWTVDQAGWDQVVSCVQKLWAPFDIEFTDVDPGAAPHIEAVVAGRPENIGSASVVGGVAPFRSDCEKIENAVVFAFADGFGGDYRAVCEATSQEIAHVFGLDHEYLCSDPMTYLVGCGDKLFRNEYGPCGEFEVAECRCGGTAQNSVQALLSRVGARGEQSFPDVRLRWPATADAVAPGFELDVAVEIGAGVDRVELFVDGVSRGIATSPAFDLSAPNDLGLGVHEIRIVGADAGGNTGASTAIVDVSADGASRAPDELDDAVGVGCSATGRGLGFGAGWLPFALLLFARRNGS